MPKYVDENLIFGEKGVLFLSYFADLYTENTKAKKLWNFGVFKPEITLPKISPKIPTTSLSS